jgi:hypothetical protein
MMLKKVVLYTLVGVPNVGVREISTAMLDQALNGFEKDTLENEDLVRIAETAS